jgi:aromatic ring-opening dioxygenase catalytic subunit (LigB family)
MEYAYSGFPQHTYHVQYPAAGSPDLAEQVLDLLAAGIVCWEDAQGGFDHGVFVTLMMYPEADIPVVTPSMKLNYNPLEHMNIFK